MAIRWSFNRIRDSHKIVKGNLIWEGPFCLPQFENEILPDTIPNVEGVYLFCFPYMDGYVLEYAGITKSMKNRIATHIREYRKGNYNIFDMDAMQKCERLEIWHGWEDAKNNREDFEVNKSYYSKAIERQLSNYRIFISRVEDLRIRERIEAAIMIDYYTSKEPWADLVPRWMHLKGRFNHEVPFEMVNQCGSQIYGFPRNIEI